MEGPTGNGGAAAVEPSGKPTKTIPWQVAGNSSRACKIGSYGAQGSGKTTTLSILARLVAQRLGKKSAYMVDSEGGSDYVASLFAAKGIQLNVVRTREFQQLVESMESLQQTDEIIIIDSVTHFWNNLVEAYQKARNKSQIGPKDWQTIFGTWRLFSVPFVRSQCHAFVAGRLAHEYATAVGDDGKLEFYRADTKMKAGEQFGHEPDVLLYMEQVDNADTTLAFRQATSKQERSTLALNMAHVSKINIVATVEKDRTRQLMGRQFIFDPTLSDEDMAAAIEAAFAPIIDWHLRQADHQGPQVSGATERLLTPGGNEFEWKERQTRREVALDVIKSTMTEYFPSATSPAQKKALIEITELAFGTKSWLAVEKQVPLEKLEEMTALRQGEPMLIEQIVIKKFEDVEGAKVTTK